MPQELEPTNPYVPEQELYHAVIAAMQEGVVVQDSDGRIITCNASAERILGLTADELRGLTSMDPRWQSTDQHSAPVSPEQHPAVITRRTRQPQSNVIMGIHRPDGTRAWVTVNSQPVLSEDGVSLRAVVITFAEITARRQAEAALRESDERFRLLFENSLDAILLTQPDGTVLAANPAAGRMLGRTQEDLCRVGRRGLVDPHDERLPHALAERERMGSFRGELLFVRSDGTRFPAEVSSSAFITTTGALQTSMIIRDLSERKQLEAAAQEAVALQRQAAQLSELVRASRLFSEAVLDLSHLLALVAEYIAEVTGDACTVRLLTEDGAQLRPVAVHHPDAQFRGAMWQTMRETTERADTGIWRAVVEQQQVVRLGVSEHLPGDASPAQIAFLRQHPVSEIMGVPLVARGRLIGGIAQIRFDGTSPFTDADESYLQVIAERAALAIDNARLYDEARTQVASWRALAENAPDIIGRFDADLRFLYVNPAMEGISRRPVADMLGKTSRELGMPEPQVSYWEIALRSVFASGQERTLELTVPTLAGERFYQVRIAPELDPAGSVQTVLTVGRDVTAGRQIDRERDVLHQELIHGLRRLEALASRASSTTSPDETASATTALLSQFTAREREILSLLGAGLSNQQIGQRLGLSAGTVKNHITRLTAKLRVADRTAAVIMAIQLGLTAPA